MRSWASCCLTGVNRTLRDGKAVSDDLLYLGASLLDDVTPRNGCSMRSWPSSSLTRSTVRNGLASRSGGVAFDEEMVLGCHSTLCSRISSFTDGNCSSTRG
jgi:hypothetical protein